MQALYVFGSMVSVNRWELQNVWHVGSTQEGTSKFVCKEWTQVHATQAGAAKDPNGNP